jgi:hypothetical protein
MSFRTRLPLAFALTANPATYVAGSRAGTRSAPGVGKLGEWRFADAWLEVRP